MADKIPHRRIIPLYPNHPLPKPVALEESNSWFPPIKIGRTPNSGPQPSRYHSQQSSPPNHSRHRVPDNDENVPPPSTQPRRNLDSSTASNAAALGGREVEVIALTQRRNKVGHLCFSNDPYC